MPRFSNGHGPVAQQKWSRLHEGSFYEDAGWKPAVIYAGRMPALIYAGGHRGRQSFMPALIYAGGHRGRQSFMPALIYALLL